MGTLWPRIIAKSPEEAQALQAASFDRRLKNLERRNAAQLQKASVTLSGSPLVSGINSSSATEIDGAGLEVYVADTDSIVLCCLTARLDITSGSTTKIRIGVFEATDIPFADKLTLVELEGDSTGTPAVAFTGHSIASIDSLGPGGPGAHARSWRGAVYQNPYWRVDTVAAVPTPGLQEYRLSYWRDTGSGTGEILDLTWSVIVL